MSAVARFSHIINLTEKEEQELKELQSKNIKIIEIFRAGVVVKRNTSKSNTD